MFRPILVLALSCFALNVSAETIKVLEPWVPAAPPGQTILAGYMVLQNEGSKPVTLIAAKSQQFKRVEFHRSVLENGMARMQPQDKLVIEPGQPLTLAPGGYHLMLIGLNSELSSLKAVDITLQFAEQDQQVIQAPVRMWGKVTEHKHHHH